MALERFPVYYPDKVLPLSEFPEDMRQLIDVQVHRDWPPDRWLRIGPVQMANRAWWEWHWQRGLHPESRHETRRASIPDVLRQAVYDRDGRRCLACGATEPLSLDHINHWSKGGADTLANLRTLCTPCNSSRRTKTDAEWGRI